MTGLSDPIRVLDAIDATVDGMCACGCAWPVDRERSAWFAGPACQQRWQAAQADRPMRDGGRLAGILPGWQSDRAGPNGGVHRDADRINLSSVAVPAGSPYLDFWTELIARGEVYVVDDGGQPRPVPMSESLRARQEWVAPAVSAATEQVNRALPLPPGWRVEVDTTPILAGEAPRVTLTAEQQADAVEVAGLGPVLAEARVTLANGLQALLDLGLIEQPPADEREATLAAVRARRNYGPAAPVRVPRRLDPHGGRRGARRG